MKKNYTILIILFISGVLHLIIFGVAWNLRGGEPRGFYLIPLILCISYLLNVMFFLVCIGMIQFPSKGTTLPEPEPDHEHLPAEKKIIPREFIDPKLSAEKLLKKLGQRSSPKSFGKKLLANISDDMELIQGIFYLLNEARNRYEPVADYALPANHPVFDFTAGEGIPGEAVKKHEITIISDIPPDFRIIESALGRYLPRFIYMVPFIFEKRCLGLLELSTFIELQENQLNILNYCMHTGGEKLNQFLKNKNENQA